MKNTHFFALLTLTSSLFWGMQVSAQTPCDHEFKTEVRSTLSDERIDESSGLATSHRDRLLFWTHNDSGDTGRVFGVDSTGETRAIGVLQVDGKDFEPEDIEDIAMGPCTQNPMGCVFLADVGDNDEERPAVFVYQFAEPKIGETKITKFITTEIRYPDGAHNVEALIIDPNSMVDNQGPMGYLVEKTKGDARVWRVRLSEGKQKAKQVATIEGKQSGILGGLITGGDTSIYGDFIVLRTYESIVLLCKDGKSGRSSGKEFVSLFTSSKSRTIIPPDSVQAEAVAVGIDGAIWYTSENTPAPLISMRQMPATAKTKTSCGCFSIDKKTPFPLLVVFVLSIFIVFRRQKKDL